MTPIFLITGAPAVGKTTTGRALASRFAKSLHIPVDDVRRMVVSGVRHPGSAWDAGLIEQLSAARESVSVMAMRYQPVGFTVVIDDFYDPHSKMAEYDALLAHSQTHRILLYPHKAAALERNLKRSGATEFSHYIADGIHAVYGYLETAIDELRDQGWIVIDSTTQSVEQTVDNILERTGM